MSNMIKLFNIVLLGVVSLSLTACRDDNALIKQIQTKNDDSNPSGKRAFCVLVGYLADEQYPYTTQTILKDEIEDSSKLLKYTSNIKLNKHLALFSRLGLFSQELITPAEQVAEGEAIYRYDLTEEGRKYSNLTNSTTFCFGRKVIDKIISERKDKDYMGNTVTEIGFTYTVEGLPDWAKDPEIAYTFGFERIGLYVDGRASKGIAIIK